MKVYLAGSIWFATESESSDWRKATEDILGKDQCLNPLRRSLLSFHGNIAEVVTLDKLDIRRCDAVLVCFENPSVGTSMEVFYAWTLGKPIIVVNKSKDEHIPPWLHYHSTVTFNEFSEAVLWLEKHIA